MCYAIHSFRIQNQNTASRRLQAVTDLLRQPDPAGLPPRRYRAIYTAPVGRDTLIASLHTAYIQHRLLDTRGEVL
jgi:hypothetical protein